MLGQRLRNHQAVTLHLLWADFGAGKTHALLSFKQQIEAGDYGKLVAIYSALPKGCREFLDIYRAIVRSISSDQLISAYTSALASVGQDELQKRLDGIWLPLSRCFKSIAIGNDDQRNIALSWLRSEPGVPLRQLHDLSIMARIRSTDEAVLALVGVVRLMNAAGHSRVIFMVDEFQRVEALRRQQQDEINAGLHSFYNICGSGMSLILSFSFGVEENIRHFLNRELLSRADPLRLSIGTLSTAEAREFLSEIIEAARDTTRPWPLSDDVIDAIISGIEQKFTVTPRRLIKAAGLAFELAQIELEEGSISSVDRSYVEGLVATGCFDRLDDGGEE